MIYVCVKCFRIFYTNYFKNTRTTHTVIFLFPYFYAKSSNHTFIKKYQIVSTRIFIVIYTYCILLIILLSPIEGWRLVVHREKNMPTHRRNINQNNLCLIMIIDYWLLIITRQESLVNMLFLKLEAWTLLHLRTNVIGGVKKNQINAWIETKFYNKFRHV